jgi:DNA-binding HxlR family transcriptional regulator
MKHSEGVCPIEYTVELMGGKWKLPIIHALTLRSPMRFKELERQINGITPTMLTTQLRKLEAAGLVSREIFATVPPTVEYRLTNFGKTMEPMMREIEKWGIIHLKNRQS